MARSHAWLAWPPLDFSPAAESGQACITHDEANRLLLVAGRSKVFAYELKYSSSGWRDHWVCFVNEGPVLAARFSLDKRILAIQRSLHEVEFINRETAQEFWQRCKRGGEKVFGFFWTDSPDASLVLVTTAGLELYNVLPSRNGLQLMDTKRQAVNWYCHTHQSRVVLLASGDRCTKMSGYQLSSTEVVKIPKFEIELDKKLTLQPEDISLITTYGRLYAAHTNHHARELVLYRFFRDAVERQARIPLFSAKVCMSVVDNVLLLHNTDSKIVMVYETAVISVNTEPVSAPLPLTVRDPSSPVVSPKSKVTLDDGELYNDSWTFLDPDMVLDHAKSFVFKLFLDLDAISTCTSDRINLLTFLQRRESHSNSEKAKKLSIATVSRLIAEREVLPQISRAMQILCTAYAEARTQLTPNNPGSPPSADNSVVNRRTVVSPQECYDLVLLPAEEDLVGESVYLIACVLEYINCCRVADLIVPSPIYDMTVRLLCQEGRIQQLDRLIESKAIELSPNSARLVEQAYEQSPFRNDLRPEIRAFSLKIETSLARHSTVVDSLMYNGQILEALRYARRYGNLHRSPAEFLHAALDSGNDATFVAVYKFCCTNVPSISKLQDFDLFESQYNSICAS